MQQTSLRLVLALKCLNWVRLLHTIHGFSSGPTEKYRPMPLNRLWPLHSKVLPMHLSSYYTALQAIKRATGGVIYSRTTHVWVAGCWLQFPNDTAYASASYGHYGTALFGIFSVGSAYLFIKVCIETNLVIYPEFCRLYRNLIQAQNGWNTLNK
jgi:hypothetical protein